MTRALARVLVIAAVAALGACGKDATAPLPVEPPPPAVETTFPVARATRVELDVQPWVRFREPLDSTTVHTQSVFFKLDTRRIAARVRLSADHRTIHVEPLEPLPLRRTYTVELSPQIRTVSGGGFDETWFFQFTTVSVRRLEAPGPPAAALQRGPLQPLSWRGTESSAGVVLYDVWFGADSAQVAAEASGMVTAVDSVLLPSNPWPLGTRQYWKVRARNLDTGDSETGPVWSFETLPEGTPIDSITVPFRDSGTWRAQSRTWVCPDLQVGNNLGPVARFDFATVDPDLRVFTVALLMRSLTTLNPNTQTATLYEVGQAWRPCDYTFTSVAPTGQFLASMQVLEFNAASFSGPALSTQVQARIARVPGLRDYTLRGSGNLTFTVGGSNGMRVYYYRLAPPPP